MQNYTIPKYQQNNQEIYEILPDSSHLITLLDLIDNYLNAIDNYNNKNFLKHLIKKAASICTKRKK